MPTNSPRFDAVSLGQTTTHTVGGTAATSQVYTFACNGKSVAYVAVGGDTNSTIAASLLALIQAATNILEFADAQFTISTNVITATSTVPGVPYTFATSATGTGTFVTAITQNPSGQNHVDDPTNWTLGRIPAGACAPPVQSSAVAASGGSLTNSTTYYWVITATNALGETLVSNQDFLNISSPNNSAVLSWAYVPGSLGYKIYRSTTSGTYGSSSLVASVSGGSTLTHTDTGTATVTGQPPGSNTAIGDDVYISNSSVSLTYGLPSDYLQWNSLTLDSTYTGSLGLPDVNGAGYYEYRQKTLMVAPVTVIVGSNSGSSGGGGCPFARIDTGTLTSVAWQVYQTGQPATQGFPALWIKGANSGNTLVINQGVVGCAVEPGDTAQFSTIEIGYQTSPATDVQLTLGVGCTLATITALGGIVNCSANITTLQIASGSQGTFYLNGVATIGTISLYGGNYFQKSTGTLTTVLVDDGATFDHSQDIRAFAITNLTLRDGCTFSDPAGTCVKTNGAIIDGSLSEMTVDFGTGYTISFS